MKNLQLSTRSPGSVPLALSDVEALRELIALHGARRLVHPLGVSMGTIERAASGGLILRGSRVLIVEGLRMIRLGSLEPQT
jgi:hypothetical protein